MKPKDIIDRVVVAQLALDDEVPFSVSEKMWAATVQDVEENPAHRGDCVKEPQTCPVCFVQNRIKAARALVEYVYS